MSIDIVGLIEQFTHDDQEEQIRLLREYLGQLAGVDSVLTDGLFPMDGDEEVMSLIASIRHYEKPIMVTESTVNKSGGCSRCSSLEARVSALELIINNWHVRLLDCGGIMVDFLIR